jgi:dihydropteroate synthase
MGIVNVTPDSFSGDGLLADDAAGLQARALGQARRFVAAGAEILDIGGESTRPGAAYVSAEVEAARVAPVIAAVARELDVLISVDTYKAAVAAAAMDAGAHLINDVWGLQADPELGAVAARTGAGLILMHNRASWAPAEVRANLGASLVGQPYTDLLADVQRELRASVALAHAAGVADEKLILDPGIGFGKTREQNLELIRRLDELRVLGYPLLLGPSRKSFIGTTLDLPPEQRLEGTAAAVAIGIDRGADIVRVHDVLEMTRVARLTDAIVRPGRG